MCKDTGDLKAASVNPDDPAFCAHHAFYGARSCAVEVPGRRGTHSPSCAQLSQWLLGKIAGKTAWNEVTFADVDSTTWSGSMSLSEHLAKFGPECCGSAGKTRPQTQTFSAGAGGIELEDNKAAVAGGIVGGVVVLAILAKCWHKMKYKPAAVAQPDTAVPVQLELAKASSVQGSTV
jgi:hypothetical protein